MSASCLSRRPLVWPRRLVDAVELLEDVDVEVIGDVVDVEEDAVHQGVAGELSLFNSPPSSQLILAYLEQRRS